MKLTRISKIRVNLSRVDLCCLMLISAQLIKLRINFWDVNYHYPSPNLWHTPDIIDTAKQKILFTHFTFHISLSH